MFQLLGIQILILYQRTIKAFRSPISESGETIAPAIRTAQGLVSLVNPYFL